MKRVIASVVILLAAGCSALPSTGAPHGSPDATTTAKSTPGVAAKASDQTAAAQPSDDPAGQVTAPATAISCAAIPVPDVSHTGSANPGGYPPDVPILAGGPAVSEDEIRATGFELTLFDAGPPLQALIPRYRGDAVHEVDEYYAASIPDGLSANDFIAGGGVLITQGLTEGQDAQQVVKNVMGGAVVVDLGPFDAAVIWGNPLRPDGARPYRVYWSDGKFDWAVIAGTDTPDEAVAIAQSIYCGRG